MSSVEDIIADFNIGDFGKSQPYYAEEDLYRINAKILHNSDFSKVQDRLCKIIGHQVEESFWQTIRNNIQSLHEAKTWWHVMYSDEFKCVELSADDVEFISLALDSLPAGKIEIDTWSAWCNILKERTDRKGKKLFLVLRKAITGLDYGPEMQSLLLCMGRDMLITRLQKTIAQE